MRQLCQEKTDATIAETSIITPPPSPPLNTDKLMTEKTK
jgi:hypothetical protein